MYAAGGVAAALFARERTGAAQVVDVSLLGAAVWGTAPHIAASSLFDIDAMPRGDHQSAHNPISNTYRTRDGRFVALVMLESDRFWTPLVELSGDPILPPTRVSPTPRREAPTATPASPNWTPSSPPAPQTNGERCSADSGESGPLSSRRGKPVAIHKFSRTTTSGRCDLDDDAALTVAMPPVQFNDHRPSPRPAPELGADTDRVLLELGLRLGPAGGDEGGRRDHLTADRKYGSIRLLI